MQRNDNFYMYEQIIKKDLLSHVLEHDQMLFNVINMKGIKCTSRTLY
jgi:hypothetical protein